MAKCRRRKVRGRIVCSRKRSSSRGRSRRRGRKSRPAGMAKRGSKCTRYKRVRVRGGGIQRRCAHYRRR